MVRNLSALPLGGLVADSCFCNAYDLGHSKYYDNNFMR